MFRKHNETKQRFTIKKYSFGAASVLIGIFFAGATAQASETTKPETAVVSTAAIEKIVTSQEATTTAAPVTTAAQTPVVKDEPKTEAPKVEEAAKPAESVEQPPVAEAAPVAESIDNADAKDVNGLIVTASGEVKDTDPKTGKILEEPTATVSVDIEIPVGKYKAGDTLDIKFENLFTGVALSPVLELKSTNKEYIYGTLKAERGTVTQDSLVGVNTEKVTAITAASSNKTTLEDKMAANIPFQGATTVYTYVFNKNVEALENMRLYFTVENAGLALPAVSKEKSLEGKVYVDGVEVLNLPYSKAPETSTTGTSGPFTVDNWGTIYLKPDGTIQRMETTVGVTMGENALKEGGTFDVELNDTEFSKFVSTGPTTPFAIAATQYPMVANQNDVYLNTTGGIAPKLQVVAVTDNKVTFKVVEGELAANTGYSFYLQGNNPDKGARRIFSTDTQALLRDAIAKKAGSIASPERADITATGLTAADGTPSITDTSRVGWRIFYPKDFGGTEGDERDHTAELLLRFVTQDTGSEIFGPTTIVDRTEGILSGTVINRDRFSSSAPTANTTIVTEADAKNIAPTRTEVGGIATLDVTAPYIVKGTDGKLYQFVGYAQDSQFAPTKQADVILAETANIVAEYKELAFGRVNVRYLDTRGNELKSTATTSYRGYNAANPNFDHVVGKDYDVTGEAPVTTRPETIEKDGFTYILVKEPTNLKGQLSADTIFAEYYYDVAQKANITFTKQEDKSNLGKVDEQGLATKAISPAQYVAKLKELVAQGYEVVTDGFSTSTGTTVVETSDKTFDNNAAVDQAFEVVLKERVIDVTDPNDPNLPQEVRDNLEALTEVVNQTVKFVEKANEANELAPAETDKVEFTRTVKYNMVTKEVTYTDWVAKDNDVLEAKKAKVVEGFLAETAEVAAVTVKATDADRTDLIKYVPIGKYIIEVPGKPAIETPYKNDPTDPTAIDPNDKPNIPYVPGYTPKDGDGNPLTPVNPNDPTEGYIAPPAPTDGKPNTTIKYVADDQTAIINFEKQEDGSNLGSVTEKGKTAEVISKAAYQAKLDELIKKGYEVVSDEFKAEAKYDDNAKEDQNFKVVLKELVVPISPDAEPGKPVFADKPNGPVWPDNINDVLEEEEVVRTISYVNDKGETVSANVDQKLGFHRPKTINLVNLVTFEITQGDWTPNTADKFEEVKSPVVTGYLADRATVAELPGVKATDADIAEKVVYTPVGKYIIEEPGKPATETPYANDPQDPTKLDPNGKPNVPYVPGYTPKDGNGNDLPPVDPQDPTKGYIAPPVPTNPGEDTPIRYVIDKQTAKIVFVKDGNEDATVTESGDSATAIPTTNYETKLEEYIKQGYTVETDEFAAGDKTFDKDSTVDQNFEVVLVPLVVPVTPDAKPGQPVDPNNPNGPKWPAGVDQLVTKEEVNQTVTYVKEDGSEAAKTVTDKVEFTREASVNLVTGEISYTDWKAVNEDTTFDVKKSPVVTGFLADKKEVAEKAGITATDADDNQVVTYRPIGSFIVELPDGNVVKTPYKNDPQDPTQVDPNDKPTIPFVEGYTPKDGNGNDLPPVDPNDPTKGYIAPPAPTSGQPDTPIRYVADDQTANIVFVKDGNKDATVTEKGKSGTGISTTAYEAKLAEYLAAGYTVVTDNFKDADKTFDKDKNVDQNFEVVLVPLVVPVTPDAKPGQPVDPNNPNGPKWPAGIDQVVTKEVVNQTVKYVKSTDGSEVAPTVTDKVEFTREAKVNLVTGEISYTEWTAVNGDTTFDAKKSPVVTGFLADKAEVAAKAGLTATDADVEEKVTYSPIGDFVIELPDGSVVVVPYPNDPTDPTKPGVPTTVVPYVPGFIPVGPDGNPLTPVDPNDPTKGYVPPTPTNPGEDTSISYIPNKVTEVPKDFPTVELPTLEIPSNPGKAGVVPTGDTPSKPTADKPAVKSTTAKVTKKAAAKATKKATAGVLPKTSAANETNSALPAGLAGLLAAAGLIAGRRRKEDK